MGNKQKMHTKICFILPTFDGKLNRNFDCYRL